MSQSATPWRDKLVLLSDAELMVLGRIGDGLSDKAIARARGSRRSTIAQQVSAIKRKLNVSSRVLLGRIAGETGVAKPL